MMACALVMSVAGVMAETQVERAAVSSVESTVEIGSVNRKAYPLMNEVDVTLTTKANEDIRYQFSITAEKGVLVSGKTYTSVSGGMQDLSKEGYVTFTAADYTETIGANDSEEIVAHVTLEGGEKHTLHYVKAGTQAATDTINVVMTDCSFTEATTSLGDPVIVVTGKSENVALSLSFYGEELKKSYGKADLYDYFTSLKVEGKDVEVRDVTATTSMQKELEFTMDAYVLGADRHCYHATMKYELPAALDTVQVKATNMLIDESKINQFGQIVYSASNKDYVVELWIETNSVTGSFGAMAIDRANSIVEIVEGEKLLRILSGNVTVAKSGNVTTLSGGVLAENRTWYALELTYTRPTKPTRELTLKMEGVVDSRRIGEEGVLSVLGYDETEQWELNIYAFVSELKGEITEKQMDTYETYLKLYNEKFEMTDIYDLLEAKLTLNLKNDLLTITGDLFMQSEEDPTDAPMVHMTMMADCETGRQLDNSEEDFEAVLENYVVNTSLYEESGVILVDAADADTTKMLALAFYTTGMHERFGVPTGTYEISDNGMPGTVAIAPDAEEGRLVPSFAAMSDEKGEPKVPLWYLMEGTVTVSEVDGELAIVVDALNSFKREIHVAVGKAILDTIEIDMNDCEVADYQKEKTFQFFGQSTIWEAYVAIAKPLAEGTYEWADAIEDYCHVRGIGGAYKSAVNLTATVKKARNGYDCEAYMTCTDAYCYHIVFHYYNEAPVAKPYETRTIVAKNLKMDEVWKADGYTIYDASNDSVSVMITVRNEAAQSAKAEDLNYEFTMLTNQKTGSILRCYSGEVKYEATTKGETSLTGYLIGHDGVRYELKLDNSQLGVEEVMMNVPAKKYIENGVMVVESNGVKYNVLGIRI